MKRTVIAATFALTALAAIHGSPALSGRFDATAYECEQIRPERDGIRCAVKSIDGMGDTLLIRVHARPTDPEERVKRTKYFIRRTIHNFLASGGTWIMMRTTGSNGVALERVCSRIRGQNTEHCNDWQPAPKSSQLSFLD